MNIRDLVLKQRKRHAWAPGFMVIARERLLHKKWREMLERQLVLRANQKRLFWRAGMLSRTKVGVVGCGAIAQQIHISNYVQSPTTLASRVSAVGLI